MLEDIEFVLDWFAEVEDNAVAGQLREVAFRKGDKLRASVQPSAGRARVADLHLTDGTTALQVPLSRFTVGDNKSLAA
jgi:hypothetical protein